MFQIEMLPAREGDALWIRYGRSDAPHQILIDGGRASTYNEIKQRLSALSEQQRVFELFVVTHVDRDHIEGALKLLEDPDLDLVFKEIWFNGYDHLHDDALEVFGALQGERLTAAILRRRDRWNTAFGGGPIKVRDDESLPTQTLAGGLKLTVLSPDTDKLANLIPQWKKECIEAGLKPGVEARVDEIDDLEMMGPLPDIEKLAHGAVDPDTTLPNGSSIALLAEFEGIRVLLAADAHLDRLSRSLRTLAEDGEPIALDAFKISHHGSSGNISKDLLELVRCRRYLISTSGAYFKHPKAEAMARLLKFGGPCKTLYFNYDSDYTQVWNSASLQTKYDFKTKYPTGENGTLVVCLQGCDA